ncbi:mucin-associated surface protein (MASP), putative [Trypanosoma cruzi marinkellei]|uniref:Mucin-associated surface protein (MASP), putative n=1 Tax=Trypanosoma cruzi marinkellei TaxID=85056 RepID=K2MY84_TRYCR|nr:mucin-associated surface protein (MASP), putative [Trypanosoma cruzi marinkellei]
MAMMMTGRVLLVCALCVLWCGLSGGVRCDEDVLPVVTERSGPLSVSEPPPGSQLPAPETEPSAVRTKAQTVEKAHDEGEGSFSGVNKENAGVQTAGGGGLLGEKDDDGGPPGRNELEGSQEGRKDNLEEVNESQEVQDVRRNEHQPAQATQQLQQQQHLQLTPVGSDGGSAGGGNGSSGSPSSSGVDASSRSGGKTGPTGGASYTAVGKPSNENKAPEEMQRERAEPHNAKAAEARNNGPQQNSSAPATRAQNDKNVATLSVDDLRSSGEHITAKGHSEASQTDESLDPLNKNLPEDGNAPPESSQTATPEPKPQQEVLTSVKEETESKSMDASANSHDAQKRGSEDPASTANTMQSASTASQEGAATPFSNGTSLLQEETSTGTNTTENAQPPQAAENEKRQSGNTTATGDSDSSTAVSHTTSPLLLLLVVASAAAAAVVAA